MMTSFWGHFEEVSCNVENQVRNTTVIESNSRRVPDKKKSSIINGTQTVTDTREEGDQDFNNHCYNLIPLNNKIDSKHKQHDDSSDKTCLSTCHTQTQTKQREELDQDCSWLTSKALRTQTLTEQTREEVDQDYHGNHSYTAIPS